MQKLSVANELLSKNKHIGKLLASESVDILNIQLASGEKIPTHNSPDVAIVIVRKGEVMFNVEGVECPLCAEDLLVFEPLENHSLEAITDVDILVLKIRS